MIDNYDLILPLLDFSNEDMFYHIQIIKRRKENPELGSNNSTIVHYYINSEKSLANRYSEMKSITVATNSRLCINLNRRSYEKIAYHTLVTMSNQMMNRDFYNVKKAFSRAVGQYHHDNKKKWILDIDLKDITSFEYQEYTRLLGTVKAQIYATLPTKNGEHWITSPFDLSDFQRLADLTKTRVLHESIQKNNPTILFVP
jgi:hypothetical protein